VDRARFWAMVQAARTASRDHVSRRLEAAAARRRDLPPPEPGGYRQVELLAARLGDLPLSEVVGFHRVVEELLKGTEVAGYSNAV
jgi:hypothetical protein